MTAIDPGWTNGMLSAASSAIAIDKANWADGSVPRLASARRRDTSNASAPVRRASLGPAAAATSPTNVMVMAGTSARNAAAASGPISTTPRRSAAYEAAAGASAIA